MNTSFYHGAQIIALAALIAGGTDGCSCRKEKPSITGIGTQVQANEVGKSSPPPTSITGIGAQMRANGDTLAVMGVVPGTPAAKAGLRQGLLIQQIDGKSVAGMPLEDSVAMVRGPVGSKVQLQVVDPANHTTNSIEFKREMIPVPGGAGMTPPPGAP